MLEHKGPKELKAAGTGPEAGTGESGVLGPDESEVLEPDGSGVLTFSGLWSGSGSGEFLARCIIFSGL